MCGRLNVKDDPLSRIVSEALGVPFQAEDNSDLRPTQMVSTLASEPDVSDQASRHKSRITQLDLPWGIKPNWAKRILINAQAESVAVKPTFKRAFASSRCAIPCDGWYEWCVNPESGSKTKYLFTRADHAPVYMAGICINQGPDKPKGLVTLTCAPDPYYARFHHRLPLMLEQSSVADWICGAYASALALLVPPTISLTATVS
ncbi:MAG: DUF159 family protein [Oleiphilus sp.]|nr:MAG: DUF159 family protein [Oleiphilus sp.]